MLTDTIRKLRSEIGSAALMAVTKHQPVETILECFDAGISLFGESRVQEMAAKWGDPKLQAIRPHVKLHFIGHLQTNKVPVVCELVDAIQSVDSLRLAEKISRECQRYGKTLPLFLQVKITDEIRKYGFHADEIKDAKSHIDTLAHVKIAGLMCMAREGASEMELRHTFGTCRKLAGALHLKEISMGMSDDYRVAVEEGSTLVRIGRILY